ncbi:MAG: ABC transporter permease [Bacilli bacterium]|nr:ABC transporter permease [Bacilli bacterium]
MMSKLNYLIGISLKRKISTKWFVVANLLLAFVIVGVTNIDSIITYFGGDFNKKQLIYVIDNSNQSYELFEENVKAVEFNFHETEESSYEIKLYKEDIEDPKTLIEEDDKAWVVIFNNDPNTTISATLISEGYIDIIEYQMISSAINNTKVALAIQDTDLPLDEVADLYSPIEIAREYIDEDKLSEEESMGAIMSTVFPIVILPFFMLVIFLVQMIGAEVNDEKSTRGMEIIISNVSPKTHFFAKIIAGNLFVLLQGGLLLLFGGAGLFIRKLLGGGSIMEGMGADFSSFVSNILDKGIAGQLVYVIPLTLILMILTFVSYSLLAGVLASMTTNTEDFQQLQTPLMLILLLGYYLAMFAGFFEGATFIKVASFIPLISAILSPSLLILGQIGIIEVLISIAINIGFNWLLIKYGLKIYKVGILNYSSKGLWKKMFKALKE